MSLTRTPLAARRLTLSALLFTSACATGGPPAASPSVATAPSASADSASFVTRLGSDTLAIEQFVVAPGRVVADVVLRVPTTRRTQYVLDLLPSGHIARLEARPVDASGAAAGSPQILERAGDSLRIRSTVNGQAQTRTIAVTEAGTLPFIDMVHWPYEIALMRARAGGTMKTTQPLLSGSRVSPFEINVLSADSMAITHPSRGTMLVRVDNRGRLLGLDAAGTTRKLVVDRRPWGAVDPGATLTRWSALDASGRSIGALSGRARDTARVAEATIVLDYGTPARRGREIWGNLVSYGTVWRTGANEATHFSTDRDLVLDPAGAALVVPAGTYTLFSIPAAGGGTLIVNRQTGQAGTAYDPSRDLGRVQLTARTLREPVELFRIAATPKVLGGELRIQWDRRELVVPFSVRAQALPAPIARP